MEFLGEERAQSVQVGAVLLFGILIIAFSTYQAFVVPDQNREVEFNHNQEVQQQLQDLRNSIVSVPGTSSTEAVSVQLGTRYPSRLLALNPGPSSGTLRTDGTETDDINVTIDNASATGETGDYWTGTQPRRYNTGTVVYSPNYNLYDAPDTFYENSVAFNQFRTGNITLSEQTVVNGRSISLVALNGTLSRSSSGSTTVDVRPVSHSERTITVTNDSATTNVSVSFLTRIPESTWETELLAAEIDSTPDNGDDDRYVADVSSTDGPGPYRQLTITFERGVDYRLQLAKAGVGAGATDTSAAYLTNVSGDGAQLTRGESTELVLEVRDSYNNPVQGTTVSASVRGTNNGVIEPVQPVSDTDGRVRFRYDSFPANDTGTHQINISYVGLDDTFDEETPENVSMNVEVVSGSSSGGGTTDGFSSLSVSDLPTDTTTGRQTVSFSPEGQAILAGETIQFDFSSAQGSTSTPDPVNYANGGLQNLPPSVSENNYNTNTGSFTFELTANRDLSPGETITFDIANVDTQSTTAGPLEVFATRSDTGGSTSDPFSLTQSTTMSVNIVRAETSPAGKGSSNKQTVTVEFDASDSSGLDGTSYTVTVYESSSKQSTNKLPSRTGTFANSDGTSTTVTVSQDSDGQPPSPPYYVVVELDKGGTTVSDEQLTTSN
ncbi:hypothetical protein [Haloarcula halophila]|uniref:hypothetical protein n=1 Tax=Haloarcula TaxID=2237 RepID=UPI0023E4686D|nr:hypothetical protein [Halomicroarcula sp. DFY41]